MSGQVRSSQILRAEAKPDKEVPLSAVLGSGKVPNLGTSATEEKTSPLKEKNKSTYDDDRRKRQ